MTSIVETEEATRFWFTHRLWLKLLIAALYVPILVNLFFVTLLSGMFGNTLMGLLCVLIFIGGPASIGYSLSPSWRGIVAGIVATVTMSLAWGRGGPLIESTYQSWLAAHHQSLGMGLQLTAQNFVDDLMLTVTAFSGVAAIELVTQDLRSRVRLWTLGAGLVLGMLFSITYSLLFADVYAHGPRSNDVFAFAWSMIFALVWLSTFFVNEFFAHRVNWLGVFVWSGMTGLVYIISHFVMK